MDKIANMIMGPTKQKINPPESLFNYQVPFIVMSVLVVQAYKVKQMAKPKVIDHAAHT